MDGKLQNLESHLNARVIGQEDALARVSRAIEAAECDLNDRGPRPKGSFLFMGSRGIGKTQTAKTFTECLFGDSGLTMLFMNEYQRADDVDGLVAAIKRGVSTRSDRKDLLIRRDRESASRRHRRFYLAPGRGADHRLGRLPGLGRRLLPGVYVQYWSSALGVDGDDTVRTNGVLCLRAGP